MRKDHVGLGGRLAELLSFVDFSNRFRSVVRTIWYKGKEEPELNGDHTFQLGLVAWYMQQSYLEHLDLLKIMCYCKVHDLPEVYAGDTPAFPDPSKELSQQLTHQDKEKREAEAIKQIDSEWSLAFPGMVDYLHAYHRQEDEESRFVYALDKFLSDLNIFDDNGRANKHLKITLQDQVAYKRPRITKHGFVLELYDEFVEYCQTCPDKHFYIETNAAE